MNRKTHLAEALKAAREQAGMTKEQAGKAVGRSHKTIAAYETGTNEPSPEKLLVLCRLYGVSIGFFFPPDVGGSEANRPDELALLECFRECSPMGREKIVDYARMCAECHPKNKDDNETLTA